MKKIGKFLISFIMIFLMAFSISAEGFAVVDDIKLSIKVEEKGLITLNGECNYSSKPVTINIHSGNKTYYLNQSEVDKNGAFSFKFLVDENKEYEGKVNVNGKIKEFKFSTNKDSENNGNGSGEDKNPEGKEVEVYITVKGYEKTILSKRKIKVKLFDLGPYLASTGGSSSNRWGRDRFTKPSNAHALVQALNDAGISYDLKDYGWSLYMSMIDGYREFDYGALSGWKFKINGTCPSVGANAVPLEDGDDIVWYYISDKYPDGFENDDDGSGVFGREDNSGEAADDLENKFAIGSNSLQKEIKGEKEIISVDKSVLSTSISKAQKLLKQLLEKEKDPIKREKLKEQFSCIPIKIGEKKENVIFKIDSDGVNVIKSNKMGIKLLFNGSEIKVPYNTVKQLKDGERLEVRKEELKDDSLLNKVSAGQKIAAKLYKFNVVKIDKNNKEERINVKNNISIVIKVDEKDLRGINKKTLKIGWYNKETGLWEKIDSVYLPDKGVVVGNIK